MRQPKVPFWKRLLIQSLFALLLLPPATVFASEGGSSHYVPGAVSSFIDFPSGVPYNVLSDFAGYFGLASVSRQFPIAGLLTTDLSAQFFAWTPIFQYDLSAKVLGGQYAFTVSLPVLSLEVDAKVSGAAGKGISKTDSRTGLGDIYFSPFNLFWRKGNFTYLSSLGIYAPSGAFSVGRLANLGKNYWTFNPYFGFQYNNHESGLEANSYLGFNFNTENNATNYQSGHEIYLDFTVDKRFKNGFGVGGTGYVFQQITGDGGSGARLGSFKGRTFGLGPVISLVRPLDKKVLFAMEGKWVPEIEVQNRVRGQYVWFKFGFIFN
ncbi:MAG: transporter [bacterium]